MSSIYVNFLSLCSGFKAPQHKIPVQVSPKLAKL